MIDLQDREQFRHVNIFFKVVNKEFQMQEDSVFTQVER